MTITRIVPVVLRPGDGLEQLADAPGGEGIVLPRPVERQAGHRSELLGQDRWIGRGHRRVPLGLSGALGGRELTGDHLARRVAGQRVDEGQAAGHLVVGEPLEEERPQVLGREM